MTGRRSRPGGTSCTRMLLLSVGAREHLLSICETRLHIFFGQAWIALHKGIHVEVLAQSLQYEVNWNPRASNRGLARHDLRINNDAVSLIVRVIRHRVDLRVAII